MGNYRSAQVGNYKPDNIGVQCFETDGDQTITTSTFTAITWDSEGYDETDMHNNSSNTSRITIQTSGIYIITFNGHWASNSTGYRMIAIRLNGTLEISNCRFPAQSNSEGSCSLIDKLAAGDYLEAMVYQTSGGNLNFTSTDARSHFSAHKIGAN